MRLQVLCRPDFLGAVPALELEVLVRHLVGLAGAQRAAPLPAVLALVPLVRRVRHPRVRRQLLLRVEHLGARRAGELDPLVYLGCCYSVMLIVFGAAIPTCEPSSRND